MSGEEKIAQLTNATAIDKALNSDTMLINIESELVPAIKKAKKILRRVSPDTIAHW